VPRLDLAEHRFDCSCLDAAQETREFVRIIGGVNGRAHATVDGVAVYAEIPQTADALPTWYGDMQ
jgi:hypothetical protein